jgi:hypothetical protein
MLAKQTSLPGISNAAYMSFLLERAAQEKLSLSGHKTT